MKEFKLVKKSTLLLKKHMKKILIFFSVLVILCIVIILISKAYSTQFSGNMMDVFPENILSVKNDITEVYFIDETADNINSRYEKASIKADLTYNLAGNVKGWLEVDSTDFSKYILYVASNGIIYLNTGDYLFSDWNSLKKIDFENVNTSKVYSMYYMFHGNEQLESLNLDNFDTSNVTDMGSMFYGCESLKILDLSSFDTSKVTNMQYMFSDCRNLTYLDLSSFNTRNVSNNDYMFLGSSNLENLSFDNIPSVFYDTSILEISSYIKINSPNLKTKFLRQIFKTTAVYGNNSEEKKDDSYVVTGDYLVKDNQKYYGYINGDVNGDGDLSLSDVMKIADYLYQDNTSLKEAYLKAADYDENNKYSLSDVMKLANKIYSSTDDDFNNVSDLDKITIKYEDLISFETNGGKDVYPVIDLLVATNSRIKGEISKIDEMIRNLKNLGFTKVYFVTLPDDIPSIGWGLNKAVPDGVSYQYWESAMRNTTNNINKAFADSCHKYGMEAIAIYKPYENGGGTSYPTGKNTAYASFLKNKTAVSTIGGMRSYFSTLVSENTDYRLKRKYNETEINNSKLAINKVEMSFYNDSVTLSGISLNTLNTKTENKPTLWISQDNGEYFVYDDFTYQYTYSSSYKIKDVNNFATDYTKPVITLTLNIKNLEQKYRYVAVSFSSNHYFQKNQSALNNGYATFPHSMIKLYNDTTEIPSSIAYFVRTVNNQSDTPTNHMWGDEGTPVNTKFLKGIDVVSYDENGRVTSLNYTIKNNQSDNNSQYFYKWGFEFQYKESNISVTMGLNSPVYGIAAGKDEYAQSLVCEGYEGVRNYWLDEVKELLQYYDGIDIRTTTHSGNVPDYAYYGYNEPIANRYYEKYEVKLEDEPVNYVVARRISEIRGEFFLKFLESVSSYSKLVNKEMTTDFYVSSYETYDYQDVTTYKPLLEDKNQFYYWFNSKMIVQHWKKAIDVSNSIIYKDIFTPSYNSTNKKIGTKFLNYAKESNKEVLIHCYTTQGNNNCPKSFFDEVDNSQVDGVLVYEIVPWTSYDSLVSNLKSARKTAPIYTINTDTITGIKTNTKVIDFVKNLNMAGTFVVLDKNGNSVSKDSYIENNMTLVMNDKYRYTINIT